jgi:hypothetical protein
VALQIAYFRRHREKRDRINRELIKTAKKGGIRKVELYEVRRWECWTLNDCHPKSMTEKWV